MLKKAPQKTPHAERGVKFVQLAQGTKHSHMPVSTGAFMRGRSTNQLEVYLSSSSKRLGLGNSLPAISDWIP